MNYSIKNDYVLYIKENHVDPQITWINIKKKC